MFHGIIITIKFVQRHINLHVALLEHLVDLEQLISTLGTSPTDLLFAAVEPISNRHWIVQKEYRGVPLSYPELLHIRLRYTLHGLYAYA